MAISKTKLANPVAIFAHLALHVKQEFKRLAHNTKFVFQVRLKLIPMLSPVLEVFTFHPLSLELVVTAHACHALLPSSVKQVGL